MMKHDPGNTSRFLRERGGLGKDNVVYSRELLKPLAYDEGAQWRLVDVCD